MNPANNNQRPFPKKEKVPQKLSAAFATQVSMTNDSVPEPVVILITSGKFSRQLTIHRPIGVTPFDNDCWVITPTGDVPSLLAHAKDPSHEKKADARRALRMAIAVELGLIKDGLYAGGTLAICKHSYAAGLAEAQKAFDEASVQARADYLEECRTQGRRPKKDWKFGRSVTSFLPEEVTRAEAFITDEVKKSPRWADGLKLIEPQRFETKSGVYHNQPQVPFCSINCKPDQMVDMMQQHLLASFDVSGGMFPINSDRPAFEYEEKVVKRTTSKGEVESLQVVPLTRQRFAARLRAKFFGK